jgi:asparagine synthase (glutamine-hydrolysing)
MNKELLPEEIVLRTKEAFSDGVSAENRSWYQIIQEKIGTFRLNTQFQHNPPQTDEQRYYRSLFEEYYPNCGHIVPYFWMPRWVNTTDPSARTIKSD